MAHHPVSNVEKLENQIKERLEKLLIVMHGKELSEKDMADLNYSIPRRSIDNADIRTSVDDFATILKEIKSTLGKR